MKKDDRVRNNAAAKSERAAKSKPVSRGAAEREGRLAAALRENLRRRKAAQRKDKD